MIRAKKKREKFIHQYAIKPLMICALFNFTVYSGVRLFYKNVTFHNLTSYLDERIPVWYRRFFLLMAMLICISTLATKQHVIVDVFGGVILAEFTWQISLKLQFYKMYKYINHDIK